MTTSANAQVFVNPTLPDQWLTQITTTDHVNLPNEEGAFQIINSLGAKVAEGQLQQGGGVNVQNLPAGVYLLRTHNHTYPFTKLYKSSKMKRIVLMFLLLAGTIKGFAQGTPKYILDTSNSNKGTLADFNGRPFKNAQNAALSIYKHSDFPTMPMQGYISDVFFNAFDFTPAGSTIPGLMIKMGKTNLMSFPYLNTTDYSSCIPLVESMVASQKTVYYDSLYTLQSNWWAGQWLKFHLPVPYRYDMQPLPNDTQQNLTILMSRKYDYTNPADSGKFHLSIQWLGFVNDSTRWETAIFYMDSLEHIIMSNYLSPKRYLYYIGFNGYSLSVNDPNKMKPFTVFPNPAQSTLHYSEQPSGLFSVYDMGGKQVLQGKTDSNGEIDIKPLPTGAYLLKIGEQTIRFLKE